MKTNRDMTILFTLNGETVGSYDSKESRIFQADKTLIEQGWKFVAFSAKRINGKYSATAFYHTPGSRSLALLIVAS